MRVRRLITLVSAASVALIGAQSGPVLAQAGNQGSAKKSLHQHRQSTKNTSPTPTTTTKSADGADDAMNQANQYAAERTAPGASVPAEAYLAAQALAAKLRGVGASWTELTHQPADIEPAGYNDPFWSNVGAGFLNNVGGRITSLAVDGSTIYAGAADGGVWKSTNGGANWTPIFDQMPTLSIGALAVNPADHSLWVGTGEANTNSDSYAGQGVFRSADGGASFAQVGGAELSTKTTFRLLFDGQGKVYAATSGGLYRRAAADTASSWTEVLKPEPNPGHSPYKTSFVTDVAIRPGTNGAVVLAALGWRNGDSYNGFYLSTTGGGADSFTRFVPSGAIDHTDMGRTTFGYAADGSKLYAIIQSPTKLLAGAATVLQGVFVSSNGDPLGPWTLIADSNKLCNSGSGLVPCGNGYDPGVQAWYNQSLIVDPANANHIVLGLEEVYQSFNGGASFTTISPYWNYAFACDANNTCPLTTHPDQHAVAISDGTLLIGNDGGVYSRDLANSAPGGGWTDLNATLHVLQYYDAEAGKAKHGVGVWGGLQDNGTMVLFPGAPTNINPASGDGAYVIVDPKNANNAVGEYVYLNTYLTTDGGHNFRTITPSCANVAGPRIANCDPNPRFIAPLATDVNDANHWVIGGQFVWTNNQAWNTVCDDASKHCDWTNVHDTGGSITALAVNGNTIYAGWCAPCNRGGVFGIDTNYGGAWHTIAASNLPNRYVAGLTVDPQNPGHVFAVYNGFSRRWIPSAGMGHVFESTNGGMSFTDVSGNLPDVPSDALVYSNGHLALGTDIGAFYANESNGAQTSWSRLGTGLPNTSLNNLRLNPDGKTLLAATHGRGLWTIPLPKQD
ncbi:MAG: glycosyl hydrolase [Candidatus Dormibacteraeota bacterium]|nr:glycosyl hydrolase [Candidatus Dormibacteraeota bacterium]